MDAMSTFFQLLFLLVYDFYTIFLMACVADLGLIFFVAYASVDCAQRHLNTIQIAKVQLDMHVHVMLVTIRYFYVVPKS